MDKMVPVVVIFLHGLPLIGAVLSTQSYRRDLFMIDAVLNMRI
jgi:hypothetical protein